MSRRKSDPVDIAFRAWAALDTEGKQRLADRMAGYQQAMGVEPERVAPRARQRQSKAKVDGMPRPGASPHISDEDGFTASQQIAKGR